MGDSPSYTSASMSPVSQLLSKLGMTREDLSRHSDQMRQFLVADSSSFTPERDRSPTPTPSAARGRAGSRSFTSADASSSTRRDLPPTTPTRSTSTGTTASGRKLGTMDAIIELQNASRRGKRRYEEDDDLSPLVPGSTSFSASRRDSLTRSRVARRDATLGANAAPHRDISEDALPSPLTPTGARHYRDTVYDQTRLLRRRETFSARTDSPSPSRSGRSSAASYCRDLSVEPGARSRGLSLTQSLPSFATPRKSYYKDSLPPSSSPAQSIASPYSSPARPLVNIVSSPGPMGPEPEEDEYETLPFKLPPGPHSTQKPDAPYAALIGQAILASPHHRLTLQEIYDYITIVWPHFKRNETTWMNSIRHVLSTTIVFRKVQRDRSAGRTLWAIWEEDLECFVDGGFRKEYCRDMREQKQKQAAAALARKQSAMGNASASASATTPTPASVSTSTFTSAIASTPVPESTTVTGERPSTARKAKRAKKTRQEDVSGQPPPPAPALGIPLSLLPSVSYSAPLFPMPIPGSHHQPYYAFPFPTLGSTDPYSAPTLPSAGPIFPPLPPSSGTAQHLASVYSASISSSSTPAPEPGPSGSVSAPPTPPPAEILKESVTGTAPNAPLPLPHLIISTNSASEPATLPISDDPDDYLSYPDDEADTEATSPAPSLAPASSVSSMSLPPPLTPNNSSSSPPEPLEEPKRPPPRPSKQKSRPSYDYLPSPMEAPLSAIDPCITVSAQDEAEEHLLKLRAREQSCRERGRVSDRFPLRLSEFPRVPDSPTLMRQAARTTTRMQTPPPRRTPPHRTGLPIPIKPFVTPPPRSSTPPRRSSSGSLRMSVQRTPLSHLGVHMSPSPSLAHYKSHLLPPPPAASPSAHLDSDSALMHTPSRRRSGAAGVFTPLTPRRLAFPGDSPFRTPLYTAYDPHDPSAALEEELTRIGARASGVYESPAGMFPRTRLYESPSGPSPSGWWR